MQPGMGKLVANVPEHVGLGRTPLSHVLSLWLQVTVGALLTQWGDAGFETHVKRMQQSYAHRAGTLHAAAGR